MLAAQQMLRNVSPGLESLLAERAADRPVSFWSVAQQVLLDSSSSGEQLPTVLWTGDCALGIVSSSCVLV